MKKQQTKIAKTYRLLPETVEDIQIIKESFRNQRYEFSSDAAVVQYAVGVAKDQVLSVDDGNVNVSLKINELDSILYWLKLYQEDNALLGSDRSAAKKLKDALQSF